jgi:hypothetical protein
MVDLILILLRIWLYIMIVYISIRHYNAHSVLVDIRPLVLWGLAGFLITIAFMVQATWLITLSGAMMDIALAWFILSIKIRK